MWEIFIAKKRKQEGHRYGFLRFKGVRNEKELEQQLDKICIGNKKMFVDISK